MPAPGAPFVLALGTTERRKNLPRLVAAFGRLPADGVPPGATGDHAPVELVIAGSPGDDADTIRAAIDELPPERRGRVRMLGRVDEATKAALLAHASVLAYPSLDEGFGFPLLEAMAARLPIVAARAGSIPEVAGDAALLVEPTDIDAIAGALATALSDQATRDALVEAGTARLTRFSWQTTAERLAALYHELASGNR
jgi:glycosyltransferase involved in cell wall biosynthesis